MDFHDRHGDLSVGYSPNKNCFGLELNMGHVLGDSFDEPVCLIKTAWGGKALGRGFLPPSMRATPEDWERIAADEENNGGSQNDPWGLYDRMLEEIQQALKHLSEGILPIESKDMPSKALSGFQGWNDQFKDKLQRPLPAPSRGFDSGHQRDLGHPQLPVIIGQLGHDIGIKKACIHAMPRANSPLRL